MSNIFTRIKNILFSSSTEWPVIENEGGTVGSIYMAYLVPLAALAALVNFLSLGVFGVGFLGSTVKLGMGFALTQSILIFVLTLVGTYILAFLINHFAPTFGGQKNFLNAFKLTAYASTPYFLATLMALVPLLGMLSFIGSIFTLYLLYTGLSKMMKNPYERTLGYFLLTLLCSIFVMVPLGLLSSCFVPKSAFNASNAEVNLNLPGGAIKGNTDLEGKGTFTIKGPDGKEIKVQTQGKDGAVSIDLGEGKNLTIDAKRAEALRVEMEALSKRVSEAAKNQDAGGLQKALKEMGELQKKTYGTGK